MDIAEHTSDRLVLVYRPWHQSLMMLMGAFVFTAAGVEHLHQGSEAEAFLMLLMSPLLWWLFFASAVRTTLILDRQRCTLTVHHRTMRRERQYVVSLSRIDLVRPERIPGSARSTVQHTLALYRGRPRRPVELPWPIMPYPIGRKEATAAAVLMSQWLDSARNAA